MADTAQQDSPDTPSLSAKAQAQAAGICRDCYRGPLHIRDQGRSYLPQFPRESNEAYADRLANSVFYDAFGRTVRGLSGMIFRKPPKLHEQIPEPIRMLWENIDLQGTGGAVFCEQRHRDGEVDGHFVIFVDMQRKPEGVTTLADERRAGLRPYWVGIRKADVLAADYEEVDGAPALVHFRYRETVVEKQGRYGQREVEKVREYNLTRGDDGKRRVEWVVHRREGHGTGKGEWVVEGSGIMTISRIPAVAGYVGERAGPFHTEPPHLPLALENIRHYQLVSDNDNVLHIASVPLLAIVGVTDEEGEQEVSAKNAWRLPPNSEMYYVEPEGKSLDAAAKRIEKSEHRMAILGLSLLMAEKRAAETATSKEIDKAENDSALAAHATASEDAFEEALGITAEWMGLELPDIDRDKERWVELNRDFKNLQITPDLARVLAELVETGKLTLETLWDALLRGNVLPLDFDPERERVLLDGGGLGVDEREARISDLEARLDRIEGGREDDEPGTREAA